MICHPTPSQTAQNPVLQPSEAQLFQSTYSQWQMQTAHGGDLWLFAYGSLIWRPEFEFSERRSARVIGWHRSLAMWSSMNRGTPQCPGLVLALLRGGSCQGVAFRIPGQHAKVVLQALWQREMPGDSYEPRWLRCQTPQGNVQALAFTLPNSSPSYSGKLSEPHYRQIFQQASGRYGSTLDYAHRTYESLLAEGIHDRALERLLKLA